MGGDNGMLLLGGWWLRTGLVIDGGRRSVCTVCTVCVATVAFAAAPLLYVEPM